MSEFRTSERRRRFQSQTESSGEGPLLPDVAAHVPLAADPPSDVADSSADGGSSIWKAIDDYARSGVTVVVRSVDGDEMAAKLYRTRRYAPAQMRWVAWEKWVGVGVDAAVPFQPVQYRAP